MAIHGDPRAVDAIHSLDQGIGPVEIIVVNTGVPSLRPVLSNLLDRIVLVESTTPLPPGGTRNLGVPQATAPVVAFLAADCLASPGWVAQRLLAHRTAPAVASAILPAPADDGTVPAVSLAAHMLVYARRDPDYPPGRTARYGVSYHRQILVRNGPFLDDRMNGEDTEFNTRLPAPPIWDPTVVTYHRNPLAIVEALADARRRGARTYNWQVANTDHPLPRSLYRIGRSFLDGLSLLAHLPPGRRPAVLSAVPMLCVLTVVQMGAAIARAVCRRAAG
jgi:glycosyltransferase involved in cell wall biosynthesis